MYSLTARFGRSEKYIYTRLKLNELYAPIGELLDNETITVSIAEEISTYEPDIQKDVYEKHLKEGNGEDWTGYTLNLFKGTLKNTIPPTLGNTSSTRRNARHAYTTQPITTFLPSITGADTAPTANVWKPRTQPMWQKRRRNF